MQNIEINYDLIQKIRIAKANPKFILIRKQIKYYASLYGGYLTFNALILNRDLPEAMIISAVVTLIIGTMFNVLPSSIGVEKTKERIADEQEKAIKELEGLLWRLANRKINISLEHLLEAKPSNFKYKTTQENGKKVVKEEIDIDLLAQTDGKQETITLNQSRTFPKEERVLSLRKQD